MGFTPSPPTFPSPVKFYIGTWGTGRATAASHTLDLVVFPTLPGQTSPITFTPADVGKPIAIVGAGPVDPDMPVINFVQGGTLFTTIATYVSPTQVTLTDPAVTSIYNTGLNNVCLYREAAMHLQSGVEFDSSVATGTRDTLRCSVLATSAYISTNQVILSGQPVYMTSTDPDVGDIFAGKISVCTPFNEPGVLNEVYRYELQCTSWEEICTRRCVNPFNAHVLSGVAAGQAFKLICLQNLIDEGVTVVSSWGSPSTQGPVIDIQVPIGAVVSDLLDTVAQYASDIETFYYWQFDHNPSLTVRFTERTQTPAPWNVNDTDGSDQNVLVQLKAPASHDQLANRSFLVADKMLTGTLITTFIGDGSSTAFALSRSLEAEPGITLNGVAQTVGILGVDSGFDWYWQQGSPMLTQDPSGAVLTASDSLQVTYKSSNPGVAVAYNNAGIADRSIVEGPGCIYETAIAVSAPIEPALALADVQTYCNDYGQLPQDVDVKTLRPGLRAGMTQHIRAADIGVNADYLIAKLKMTMPDGLITWGYEAISGANVHNWQTALVNFINRGKQQLGIVTPVEPITAQLNKITIDHTKVSGSSDLTDFVLFFGGTYDFLKLAPAGYVAHSDGADIFFTSDPNGDDVLDFDLAYYDPTTGQIGAWVRIPTLSHAADTVIYIWYGDVSQAISLQNKPDTWSHLADVSGVPNANYHGAYHFTEASGTFFDSTKYASDSTHVDAGVTRSVASPFGLGVTFSGSAAITFPTIDAGFGFNNKTMTLEAWIKTTSGASARPTCIYYGGVELCLRDASGKACVKYDILETISAAGYADGNWHKLVCILTPTHQYIYADGVLQASDLQTPATLNEPHSYIGANPTDFAVDPYVGTVAEARASQTQKSADLILTEYRNQNSPGTFFTLSGGVVRTQSTANTGIGNPTGTVTHSTGDLTADQPVFGNGAGDVKVGTKTGTTNKVATATGAQTQDLPLLYDANGNVVVSTKQGNTTKVQMASGAAGATGRPLIYDANGNAVAGTFPTPTIEVESNGSVIGTEPTLNFIPGTGITLNIIDDSGNQRINITISAATPSTGGGVWSIIESGFAFAW